ncbi:MAG TPA: PQQ-dependent sugar dehydrogenase, partial [Chitinophagaceae bacterium]|nr:PQQ-dependent sugar dehydrogenase [Chitinophagaceae bacterium]
MSPPDSSDRLFIVQKVGSVKVYDKAFNFLGDFVTVSGVTINGERGLLSMAFHPDYKSNGLFFVYYTNLQGDIEISRYKVSDDPNRADTTTRTIIITIPHRAAANHNGGKIGFGADGYLYFATGDGGNGGDPPNNAQNGKVLLGKMLRIDVNNPGPQLNYSIPTDNPFVNDTLIADEIWALGLRNPFRWSFDRLTHNMWIADVGQGVKEEINFRKAGETKGINYGWRCYEGKNIYNASGCKTADQYIPPIFDYPHNLTTGGSSVTGGYVYRGSEYPSMNGYYIFADYISNNQWLIKDSSNGWSIKQQQSGTFPRNIAG